MHSLINTPFCRKACQQTLCCALIATLLVAMTATAVRAADDPYLEMLDQEATKVESGSSDTGNDGGDSANAGAGSQPASTALPSRERFESLLRRQNVGTYSFYRKLPERSREEIFLDYSNGASMEALREKIVDRYLHP